MAGVVARWEENRVRIKSSQSWLPDFCDGRGRRQRASHRQHRRARHRAALVARREDDLFHQLRGERLWNGLRDLNGELRTATFEGKLIRAPGCFLSCGFVQFEYF